MANRNFSKSSPRIKNPNPQPWIDSIHAHKDLENIAVSDITDTKREMRAQSVEIRGGNKKLRASNLELYSIVVMLLIVAHHYVVNSGLMDVIQSAPASIESLMMLLFGAWGKTGIDCFVLITGYFMCKSNISWNKLLKLYLQIVFYTLIIYAIFCVTCHESLTPMKVIRGFMPIHSITNDFASCFLIFYLCIPFINILIQHLDKKLHKALCILLIAIYSVWPTLHQSIALNYVSCFFAIYIIASYIRIYGFYPKISTRKWGIITLIVWGISIFSIILLYVSYKYNFISQWAPHYFVHDSNKILALCLSISSFMWFKGISVPYSKFINLVGASTFGVLLIHANSEVMRNWLWREMVDCIGHFGGGIAMTLIYAVVSVIVIFSVCTGIEWFRGKYIEPHIIRLSERGINRLKTMFSKI